MRRHSKLLLCFLTFLMLFAFGCGSTEESEEKNTQEEAVETEQVEEPELIEIKDLSSAWDVILNGSTKAFIGGHPIDESFLANVTSTYGDEVIENIAAYANFESPEIWYTLTGKSIHVLWYEYCRQTGIQNYAFENTYVFDTSSDSEVVLDFTGDFTLANDVATTTYMDQQINGIVDCFSLNLITEMKSADVLMINNEFAYTECNDAIPGKAYTFKAYPNRISLLRELGVDVLGVANNHVFDYGEEGFLDTIETIENSYYPYVGAGRDLDEASKPLYIISGGRKIAIVAATQIERSHTYTQEATEDQPGVLKCLHPENFVEEIKEAKYNADYVIVFVHWGTEGVANYGSDQYSLARKFVEAGADAIIGGHTHCLQTMEYMDDVPIYYSLGNFFFSLSESMPSDYDTGIAQLRILPDGKIESYFIPCRFSNGVVTKLKEKDDAYGDIIDYLNSLSETVEIEADGHITKKNIE